MSVVKMRNESVSEIVRRVNMIRDEVLCDEKALAKKLAEKNKRVIFKYIFCKKTKNGGKNVIDKIFDMLLRDKTEYTISTEKLDSLERLSTSLQWMISKSMDDKRLRLSDNARINLLKEKLVNMQWLLMQFATIKTRLNKRELTISEIFNYITEHNLSLVADFLKVTKELIILSIVEEYLMPKNTMIREENYIEK